MTTIIGLQHDDKCLIVSDSRVSAGGKVYTHPNMVKVVERANYIIAGAGDYRALQVVLHGWTPPLVTVKAKANLYEFAINKVIPSLKVALTESGVEFNKTSNDDDKFELNLLIAINGNRVSLLDEFDPNNSIRGAVRLDKFSLLFKYCIKF